MVPPGFAHFLTPYLRRAPQALAVAGVLFCGCWVWAQAPLAPPANGGGPGGREAINPNLIPPGVTPSETETADRTTESGRPGRTVVAVEVVGNKSVTRKKVMEKIKVRAGHTFDEEQIERDVGELNRSGLFVEVRPKSRIVNDGVVVVFEVVERPTIQHIKIVGNDEIRDKKLIEKIGVKKGGPLSPYEIEEGRRKIEEFYRERGYNRVQVSVLEGTKPTDKGVVYLLNEGKSQKIMWTSFVGNTIVSDSRLKTQIQSKPGFAWIIKGYVDHKKIDEDVERLTAYYRSLGYFRAQVRRTLDFNEDRNWLSLTFVIHEGERYKIHGIKVEGNDKIDTARLTKELQLKNGEFFDQVKMGKDVNAMLNEYGGEGYVFADVKPETRFHEEPGQLDLVYKIKEGDRYRIGEVNVVVEGESPHTKVNVAKNNVHLRPGDIADIREIRESQRRLMRAGVFERQDPSKMPQIKFQRPEDGETNVVGRTGVRKVRGQSPDDGSRTLDVLVVYDAQGEPTMHLIERGLPRTTEASERDVAPLPPERRSTIGSGYAARQSFDSQDEARGELPDAPDPTKSYYQRVSPSAPARRHP